jgi:uncharacterized UPF0160 family protein
MMLVGTHDGVFHADDVAATAVLELVYGEVHFVRTRETKTLASCEVVFDVGGVYDPSTKRFDHHQKDHPEPRANGVKYASFGLLWKEHGQLLAGSAEAAEYVDAILVQAIDAADNGQALSLPNPELAGRNFSISSVISSFNPGWEGKESFDSAFVRAVAISKAILQNVINAAKGRDAARVLVEKAIVQAVEPRVIVLEKFAPWTETVTVAAPDALFVAYPSETGDWRLQCVPPTLGSFEKRKALPASWAGLRGSDLAAKTGVADAIFCHVGLFICGAQSREGVLELARQALA